MRNAIEFNISGIKCDHCDYTNMDVKLEEYDEWLNKPCPKCGENLLTEEDLNNTKILVETIKAMNNILPQQEDHEEDVTMEVKMNGTGSIEFDIKK